MLHPGLFEFLVEVQHSSDVSRARPGVEICQHSVGALLLLQLGYLAVGIIDISEDNGLGAGMPAGMR